MKKSGEDHLKSTIYESAFSQKHLIKPIYTYMKRKSNTNTINDFNVIYRSRYR